jgi:hypothetical protein
MFYRPDVWFEGVCVFVCMCVLVCGRGKEEDLRGRRLEGRSEAEEGFIRISLHFFCLLKALLPLCQLLLLKLHLLPTNSSPPLAP